MLKRIFIISLVGLIMTFGSLSAFAGRGNAAIEKFADEYAKKWLLEYRTATEISFVGKNKQTMKIKVNFRHNKAKDVIHDPSLIDDAKKVGVKRIEFHDWGKFSKEYIYHDIK